MDNERTADVLQVALASYDRKELRVQKNYLEEQNPVLACTCFLNGHKLLQELQQGHNFDIVVLCSQMEDMSGIRRMIDQLEAKPAEGWTQFKAESGFEAEKPTTGKLIYAIKRYLIQQKSRE